MPLTGKGRKIMGAMKREYGPEKGERVFYASRNKGTIRGVDEDTEHRVRMGAMRASMHRRGM